MYGTSHVAGPASGTKPSASGSAATGVDTQGRERITLAAKSIRAMPGSTVPLDVEGYPEAPSGLQLEQVHLYVRHGELQTLFTPSGFWNVHILSFTHTHYFLNAYSTRTKNELKLKLNLCTLQANELQYAYDWPTHQLQYPTAGTCAKQPDDSVPP